MKRILAVFAAALSASAAPIRPAQAGSGWTLLAWNDLGMHCMDGDYSVFSILPPYNTIHAQLLDASGELVTNPGAVQVTYQAVADSTGSINTTSAWKSNFWQYAAKLFGAALAPDTGLTGNRMPGSGNQQQSMKYETALNWFTADGIPVTPFDDKGKKNYYPMMRLTARNASGAVLASTDIVLPVSDEMDCRACHASGSQLATKPASGWAYDPLAERDYKINILRLHDQHRGGLPTFIASLAAAKYSSSGLAATAAGGTPVLCAACHASNALSARGQPGVPALTTSIHGFHARVADPVTGLPLDATENRDTCYRCHPGSATRCLRGVMGNAVAADGTMAMQCQSCHGDMRTVGGAREGWLDQPNCQACHTGTAVKNAGQIRFTSTIDPATGSLRKPADLRFATNPDVPAAGFSLYRFSAGHGGVQCEGCHGSTHAEFPSSHANDNVRSIATQGYAGTIGECTACHGTAPLTASGGPHGMHTVGGRWIEAHGDAAEDGRTAPCQACHGADLHGTVLSKAWTTRTFSTEFGTRQVYRGAIIGCYMCHNGPGSETETSSVPAVLSDTSAETTAATPVSIPLSVASGTLRIVSQPANATVALDGNTARFFPLAGFEGTDTFTFASWDGNVNSNLASADVKVVATARPVFSTEGIVNAASFRGGAIAPGEMITIFGSGMGPSTLTMLHVNSAGLLSRWVAGTRVLFGGYAAPLVYASAGQVTAVVPYSVAGQTTTMIQVEYGGIKSAAVEVPVVDSALGVFDAVINEDGVTPNGPNTPAPKGSAITLFATGEGLITHEVIDGEIAGPDNMWSASLPVSATVGGVPAAVEYGGAAPGNVAGFMQVNLRIPAGAPTGDAIPVVLTVGGSSSPKVDVAIR